MDLEPLITLQDRFPFGLAGHIVPIGNVPHGPMRPWGMEQARPPSPVEAMGKHEKQTGTRKEKVPTSHSMDSKMVPDDYTRTVTD